MRQEPSTTDGLSRGNNLEHPFSSALGIRFGGIHLERAHRSGVTRIITPPLSEGFLHGLSTCFRAGAKNSKSHASHARAKDADWASLQ